MLGLMLGFGLVAGLVIGFEFLDDRIRGPAEIEAAIGGPAPDPIPLVSGNRFDRVLLDHPDDPAGAAIRALVIRLNRERTCHQARVFAFCPSGPGVGNTSLALNTAHGLARYVPKVLMISFSPAALKIAHAGVALLKEPSGLVQAVTHDAERGVDLVAIDLAGERLPSKVGVALLIDRVRRAYDVVVLDLGIVPQDDLAMSLLHEVDSVIFTAREDMTMFTELRRAIDSASLAGVPSMTAVLNGSRRPSVNRLPVLLQQGLRQVSGLHHRAREEWKRRLKRGGAA
jgi:Mrp family chromosome partitioning ATPase